MPLSAQHGRQACECRCVRIVLQELKLQGATGPLASLHKKHKAAVSDTEVGVGGTSSWRLCALNRQTSVGIFFEVASSPAQAQGGGALHFVLQFSTQYQHPSGQNHLRVSACHAAVAGAAATQLACDASGVMHGGILWLNMEQCISCSSTAVSYAACIQPGTACVHTWQMHGGRAEWRRPPVQVVTIARPWAEKDTPALGLSFDQEAAAVVLARQALTRCVRLVKLINVCAWCCLGCPSCHSTFPARIILMCPVLLHAHLAQYLCNHSTFLRQGIVETVMIFGAKHCR